MKYFFSPTHTIKHNSHCLGKSTMPIPTVEQKSPDKAVCLAV